ncbi:hypothetical protein TWF696_000241 [Orbilia brochopaga]|uniref:Uncharacterized protein n=1 Tax=Orbilia brochopaga TaxID=3140254 RepID=A0AAV9VDE8_9PEZI
MKLKLADQLITSRYLQLHASAMLLWIAWCQSALASFRRNGLHAIDIYEYPHSPIVTCNAVSHESKLEAVDLSDSRRVRYFREEAALYRMAYFRPFHEYEELQILGMHARSV